MKTSLSLLTILAFLFAQTFTSCKKNKEPNCGSSFLSQAGPTYLHLKFVDGQTGANLLTTNKLITQEVKVSIDETTEQLTSTQWRINTDGSESSPIYGTVQLVLLPAGVKL